MYAHHGGRSHRQRAVELLAREWQVPVDEVAQIYEDARAELEVGARIRGFLDIFATRTVRQMLRQRSASRRLPTQEHNAPPGAQRSGC